MGRTTIDELLADARHDLTRLDPTATRDAMRRGAALIDIRGDSQLAQDGAIAGALVIPRNVLEWRLDPTSRHRHPHAPDLDDQVIVMCNDGFQSSLAAATLQLLGFTHAADLDGGFQAWRAAGLPVEQFAAPDESKR
jgi:rhodanese-related sulfurtransferase